MPANSDNISKNQLVSEREIEQYQNDGVVCLRGVFDLEWIEKLKHATEEVLNQSIIDFNTEGGTGNFVGDLNVWQKNEVFRAFAFESPAWQIAKTLMQSSTVNLYGDQMFVKEPGTSTPSPWHHDQTYWPVVGDHVCSIWVPMDVVTRETSGLEYVRGSHRWGRRFDPADFGGASLEMFRDASNEKIPDIDANREAYDLLSWDLEPGDCLVHHSLAVHGAGGNRSQKQRRRALSVRWLGDDAYFEPKGPFTSDYVGLTPGDQITKFNTTMWPKVPSPDN